MLGDELLQECLESIRQGLYHTMEKSDPSDKEGRERVYYQLRNITGLEKALKAVLNDGKISLARLGQQASGSAGGDEPG